MNLKGQLIWKFQHQLKKTKVLTHKIICQLIADKLDHLQNLSLTEISDIQAEIKNKSPLQKTTKELY